MYNFLDYMIRSVEPTALQEDVALDTTIKIYFTEPIDSATVNDSNFWVIKDGDPSRVSGTVAYVESMGEFILSWTPDSNLDSDTTYSVTLRGESESIEDEDDIDEGIKTFLGQGIVGNYSWTFTTGTWSVLDSPTLISPSDKISIEDTPIFSWSALTGADTYEIYVSYNPSFENYVWNTSTTLTSVSPPFVFGDGKEYWWKIRAVDSNGYTGNWSAVRSFYKGDVDEGYVSPQDEPYIEYPYSSSSSSSISVDDVFPSDESLNLPLNINYFALKIKGYVSPEDVTEDSFIVVGEPITMNSEIMDGQNWWSHSTVAIPSNVSYYNSETLTADVIRRITVHGKVDITRMVIYDPESDETILIGIPFTATEGTTSVDYEPIINNSISVRNSLVGVIDGYNTEFELPQTPVSNTLQIFVDGELFTDYTLSGTIVTFDNAPTVGTLIEAIYSIGYTIIEQAQGTIDGSNTIFTIGNTPLSGTLQLYLDDELLTDSVDYVLVGSSITMIEAPTSDSILRAEYQVSTEFVVNETPSGVANGVNVLFTLSNTPNEGSEQIYVNGVRMIRDTDYTMSGSSIIFSAPPSAIDIILAEYFVDNPIIIGEVPATVPDGTITTFTLTNRILANTLEVFINGELIDDSEVTVSANSFTLSFAPDSIDTMSCNYRTYSNYSLPYPNPTSINYLLPNNRYVVIFKHNSLSSGAYISWFTSQYWPLFSTLNDVKYELNGVVDVSDHELYYKIREKSIEAIFIQTSPMHYLIRTPYDILHKKMLEIPFDPNSPAYCVHMYVKLRTAYDVLLSRFVYSGITSGGKKTLGELEIERGEMSNAPIKTLLAELKEKLAPWDDCIHGITGRGRLQGGWTVKGMTNYRQHLIGSDYPLYSRISCSPTQPTNNRWRRFL